jgi:hypothetical protein
VTFAEVDKLAALAGLDGVPEYPWPAFLKDSRIKAVVPLASAGARRAKGRGDGQRSDPDDRRLRRHGG